AHRHIATLGGMADARLWLSCRASPVSGDEFPQCASSQPSLARTLAQQISVDADHAGARSVVPNRACVQGCDDDHERGLEARMADAGFDDGTHFVIPAESVITVVTPARR